MIDIYSLLLKMLKSSTPGLLESGTRKKRQGGDRNGLARLAVLFRRCRFVNRPAGRPLRVLVLLAALMVWVGVRPASGQEDDDNVRMVPLAAQVEVPPEIGAVDVKVAALGADGVEVEAGGKSSVLIASDADGTLMLAAANEDGGYLGEGPGAVELGIESTAITLVAVASGRRFGEIDPELVQTIRSHEEFGRLTGLLEALMAADKNYLDRLYSYPQAVTLIKSVAAGVASAGAEPSVEASPGFKQLHERDVAKALAADDIAPYNSETGPIAPNYKGNFYCVPGSGFWSGFLPCSPWDDREPWHWFGEAQGVTELFPNNPHEWRLFIAGNPVEATINFWGNHLYSDQLPAPLPESFAEKFANLVFEATGTPPFLAASEDAVSGCQSWDRTCKEDGLHATANPNFVHYAMELYDDGVFQDWLYTPGNSTVSDKLLNSGAAYREFRTGPRRTSPVLLSPHIDRVRFQRYRFSLAEGDEAGPDRGAIVSFMNTLHLIISVVNVITDVSEARAITKSADVLNLAEPIAACSAEVFNAVKEAYPEVIVDGQLVFDSDPGKEVQDLSIRVLVTAGSAYLSALQRPACQNFLAGAVKGGVSKKVLKEATSVIDDLVGAGVRQGAKTAADLALIWVKLGYDAANDLIPVLTAYFRPAGDGVDYQLFWKDNPKGDPYIHMVSKRRPPTAQFTYTQRSGFRVELDASQTMPGDSDDLTFSWGVNDASVGRGERLLHDFGAEGRYRVEVVVVDGNGLTGTFSSAIDVVRGSPPVVSSLECTPTRYDTIRMVASFSDADGDIETVEWRSNAGSVDPDRVTSADTTQVELRASGGTTWASVIAEDAVGNRGSRVCNVNLDYVPVSTLGIDSLSAACGREEPWRACYHRTGMNQGELFEFSVSMPREPTGTWHVGWCAKEEREGLCRGQHDWTTRIDKRFSNEAPLTFPMTPPAGAETFWVVAEVRECNKALCNWPEDFTEVEFHHIEVSVLPPAGDTGGGGGDLVDLSIADPDDWSDATGTTESRYEDGVLILGDRRRDYDELWSKEMFAPGHILEFDAKIPITREGYNRIGFTTPDGDQQFWWATRWERQGQLELDIRHGSKVSRQYVSDPVRDGDYISGRFVMHWRSDGTVTATYNGSVFESSVNVGTSPMHVVFRTYELPMEISNFSLRVSSDDGGAEIPDVLFSEDYESYAVGSRPEDYEIVFNGQGDAEQRVEEEGGNRHLRTAGQYFWSLAMRKDLDFDLPAVVSVSWRMRLDNDVNTYGYTDPSGARYGSFGGFGIKNTDEVTASVGINKYESDKKIVAYCRDGDGSRPQVQLGVWTEFRMDVDFAAGRYSMYKDGVKYCDTTTGMADLSGRWNSWGESSGIHFSSGNSDNTVTRFDDIVIRGGSGGETRALASYGNFHVIAHELSESQSHDAECKSQLGSGFRLADWNDIVTYYDNGGSLTDFSRGLRMSVSVEGRDRLPGEINSGYRISRDGRPIWSGNRHYFFARHDHNKPSYFLDHANLDNYHLTLGSWYGTGGHALCYGGDGDDDETGQGVVFSDDFSSGTLDNWTTAGKESVGGSPDPGSLSIVDGVLQMDATAGGNYTLHAVKEIRVAQPYGGYRLSFDWKAVERETPWGLDGVRLYFYDDQDRRIGMLVAVNSGQTRRGGDPLDHVRPTNLANDRFSGIGKLAETFDWEHVTLDTSMIPGMEPREVARLELRAWVYNDAGSGGEMHFDNFELRGTGSNAPAGHTERFDSVTYEGSGTLGNADRMRAGDLIIEVPDRTLVDDIRIAVRERNLPAALPIGAGQIADPVEISITDEDQDKLNAPLVMTMTYPVRNAGGVDEVTVMHFEADQRRWLPATVVSHDAQKRQVVFNSRSFSIFVAVDFTESEIPGSWPPPGTAGFDPAKHGFSISNRGYEYHTPGGNCYGMSAYAIYNFLHEKRDIYNLWDDTTQSTVATLAHLSQPIWSVNNLDRLGTGPGGGHPQADQLSMLKREITQAPVILLLSRPLAPLVHAVVAYGFDGDELLIYDPNFPGASQRTTSRGRVYKACGNGNCTDYSVTGFDHYLSTGRRTDWESLTTYAVGGFERSNDLYVNVEDGQEVSVRDLDFSGALSGDLLDDAVKVSVKFDDVRPIETADDGTFSGSVEGLRLGENTLVFLAGIHHNLATLAGRTLQFWKKRYWDIGSAAVVRNVVGRFDAAAVQIRLQWSLPTDLDLYVQEPGGEVLFWGNRLADSGFELSRDNRRTGSDERRDSEIALLSNTDTVADGVYRLFVHQYDDYGYNEPVDFRVQVSLNEGTISEANHGWSHTMALGRHGLGSATTVRDLLGSGLHEAARVRVHLGRATVCWPYPEGTFDYCGDEFAATPVDAVNGDQTVVKPSANWVPDWLRETDVQISIDSSSVPSSCVTESPWRGCYHRGHRATDGDLVEVRVTMPREPSGSWHGAWCVKDTPEGLCRGRHDSTDNIEKRFAENASLSFDADVPQDVTSFWIVGEIRECRKSLCYWPTDYDEVEFHHIEVSVLPPGGGESEDTDINPGDTRVFDGIEFAWIPPGQFQMGSTSAGSYSDERPVTQVRISRGFWMGKYEVTQAQWQAVMGSNPSDSTNCGGDCPVDVVSWNDVQEFIGKLNARSGGRPYRLPTEAEWEYAARAGTTEDRYGDIDEIAWYESNSGGTMHPVGEKAANAWGLHDMLGNVWEWVQDWYGSYPGGSVTDPTGPGSGSTRVRRGGSWFNFASYCRSADRNRFSPGNRYFILGFRLLREE